MQRGDDRYRMERPATAVAVPACNEEDHIDACLDALISQAALPPDHVLVLVNNTTDTTAARARAWSTGGSQVHVVERWFGPAQANAGHARRVAMGMAAGRAGPSGVVLTTDADGRVDPAWLSASLGALQRADLVAGCVALDPDDAARIPERLHQADARECAYDMLCDHIHARLDPDPWDPLPRHTQSAGASLGMTVAAFHRCGGVPAVATSEDRALVQAMRRVDARVRHAPEVRVVVSGRTEGRAAGGMAETIARRLVAPDLFLDDRLEPLELVVLRASCRRQVRQARLAFAAPNADATGNTAAVVALARALRLSSPFVRRTLMQPYFGAAWSMIEHASPTLRKHRVPVADVARETARAQAFLSAGGIGNAPVSRMPTA